MMNNIQININRILLSLDFDDYNYSFIEPLVLLAAQLKADLCGLFIEDSKLQKIANLPFSHEITLPMAHSRELNSQQIARHLKQQAELLRKMMQDFSRLSNVTCSFRTAKGPRIETILRESYNFELVILLPEKYSSLKSRQSSRLDELMNPSILLYNGSVQSKKSVCLMKALADKGELHQLIVLTMEHDIETLSKQQLSFDNVNIDYKHINSYKVSDIISAIDSTKIGLLVLPLEDEMIDKSDELRKMVNDLTCPLLLVR